MAKPEFKFTHEHSQSEFKFTPMMNEIKERAMIKVSQVNFSFVMFVSSAFVYVQ